MKMFRKIINRYNEGAEISSLRINIDKIKAVMWIVSMKKVTKISTQILIFNGKINTCNY